WAAPLAGSGPTARGTSTSCPPRRSASRRELVQRRRVSADDLALLLLGHAREVLFDRLLRVRPDAVGMWVVARPHDAAETDVVPFANPRMVLDERAVHLPVEERRGALTQT